MFLGPTGFEPHHHFLVHKDGTPFRFLDVKITSAHPLENTDAGLYFDWAPEPMSYQPPIDKRQPQENDVS